MKLLNLIVLISLLASASFSQYLINQDYSKTYYLYSFTIDICSTESKRVYVRLDTLAKKQLVENVIICYNRIKGKSPTNSCNADSDSVAVNCKIALGFLNNVHRAFYDELELFSFGNVYGKMSSDFNDSLDAGHIFNLRKHSQLFTLETVGVDSTKDGLIYRKKLVYTPFQVIRFSFKGDSRNAKFIGSIVKITVIIIPKEGM